jgi:four helix bundle protein
MFSFEKLEVWQKARAFSGEVYRIVEEFPKNEQFALSQQLRRAAVSIVANIAEGSSRSSQKEFSRYVEIAFGSLCEVIAELHIARDRGYLDPEVFTQVYDRAEGLGQMLSKFRRSLETSWVKASA